jgi:hypothetical protein
MQRSATFRDVVARIEASDTVVYIDEGTCVDARRGCLHVLPGSGQRRLQVRVDSRQPLRSVVGQLAHELQHAVEIVGTVDVTDNESLKRLYEVIGFRGDRNGEIWETRQAQSIETLVLKEANTDTTAVDDAYFGAWTLNIEQSTFENVPAPKSAWRWHRDQSYGLISVVADTVDERAVHVRSTFVYRPDGCDYLISAVGDEPLRTIAESVIDRFTSQFVIKRRGTIGVFGRRVLDPQGLKMTVESEGVDANGQTWRSVERWEKHFLH